MSKPVVDFVVCAWNNRRIISKTLESVARQTVRDFTCTLVDGGSTDGTPEFVREKFPWVNIVVKESNTGPADSRNRGMAQGSAEWIILLDSDVTLDARWAEIQIKLLSSHPEIGIACGKLLYAANRGILYGAYGAANRFGVVWDGGWGQHQQRFNTSRRCLWANTTAIAVRRAMVEQTGGFDTAMFTLYEDADFGWRANLLGYGVMFNPEAAAVHEVHGTLQVRQMKHKLVYLAWRNRLRSLLVNYQLSSLLRYTSVFMALSVLDGLVYGPRKEKLSALWWNLQHLGSTLERRKWVQSRRKVKDRELWPMFEPGLRGPGYDLFPEHPASSPVPEIQNCLTE